MESLISPKNSLYNSIKQDEIRTKIIGRISKFENLPSYRNSQELTVLITQMIEHFVKKKYQISKQDLAISIYDSLFQNFTDEEKLKLKESINFIWQNGFIKKVPYYKLFFCSLREFILKKLS